VFDTDFFRTGLCIRGFSPPFALDTVMRPLFAVRFVVQKGGCRSPPTPFGPMFLFTGSCDGPPLSPRSNPPSRGIFPVVSRALLTAFLDDDLFGRAYSDCFRTKSYFLDVSACLSPRLEPVHPDLFHG